MNQLEIILLSSPLVIVLFSIAFLPLIASKFWHRNETIIFSVVSLFSIVSTYLITHNASAILKDAIIDDYLPFIIMLFTLYVLSHGIHIKIKAKPTTLVNVGFLGCCSVFSSIIGTTGAAMLFLRPFLELNKQRKNKAHLIIFFIFIVANIGGLLTPLGDPPLLLGYLHGVEFSWELENLTIYWLAYVSSCLAIMAIIDYIKSRNEVFEIPGKRFSLKVNGWVNIYLIIATVLILFLDFDGDIVMHLPYVCDCIVPHICLKNIILIIFCTISLYNSKKHSENIDFAPFKEVATTFFIIFIVIAPVLYILNVHSDSIHKYIIDASNGTDGSSIYFWLCSLASSFLDNAPSYLLFFNMAGGDANELMYVYPNVLKAISISSVVMGAMTYIGNAPNMMVRSIAEKRNIKMPSFVGYMLWSCAIILPVSFILVKFICN
ncbi:MAG: sodium:proton antiporter [Alphaproteobacteria bacterium]|nr:sodium:proton antiporter [Alphaproteobacteria bacterium]